MVPFYGLMWQNMVEPYRAQVTVQCGAQKTLFACRITKTSVQHTFIILLLLQS